MYNEDFIKFINRNGFQLEELLNSKIPEITIVETKDLNKIASEGAFFKSPSLKVISIADIIGYDYPNDNNIFKTFSNYFDSNGDSYHQRSIEMLDYSSEDIISNLTPSFSEEPIKVKEITPNKYLINGNGYHRFTILKIHYILECLRAHTEESLSNVRKKYQIPVISKQLDIPKTYCGFIIRNLNSRYDLKLEFTSNYQEVTNRIIIIDETNNQKKVFTDDELILFTKELLKKTDKTPEFIKRLTLAIERTSDFFNFIHHHFPELLILLANIKKYQEIHPDIENSYEHKSFHK